ncbi:MAG TPA: hypothetical protein VFO49_08605 [Nocardioides sp.]|nr:hypothetical protein [Nocardioides sp.]
MYQAIDDLDPTATLVRAEAAVGQRRAAEIEDLLLVAHWADLHGDEPAPPPTGRAWSGEDRLVMIGGDGTPQVRELCLSELAVARGCHTLAARAAMADVLDLRHRLPQCWMVFLAGDCDAWVLRKVAAMARRLDRHRVGLVDTAVAEALAGESPGRVLRIAEARIIEADPEGHQARLADELRKRFVRCAPSDEHGLRMVYARIEAGDAAWIDAVVDRVADVLATRPELTPDLPQDPCKDELRAVAFGWLAHPADLIDLLESSDTAARTEQPARGRQRPRVAFYLHLHQAALDGTAAVARVEEVGPMLLDQVRRFLGHAYVDLHPVIDLNTGASVNCYEHPTAMTERARLRTPGEVFPHACRLSRNLDSDHPDPYKPHGPPGQTRDDNLAPLGRTNHRAKTHLGYQLRQRGLDTYEWTTPHGLHRRVDRTGTHHLDDTAVYAAALDAALDKIAADRGISLP